MSSLPKLVALKSTIKYTERSAQIFFFAYLLYDRYLCLTRPCRVARAEELCTRCRVGVIMDDNGRGLALSTLKSWQHSIEQFALTETNNCW